MRIEDVPVILGGITIVLGAAIVWDAWGPQTIGPMRDRRRRERANVDPIGEIAAGFGIAILGAGLIGTGWRYETITILIGALCVLVGALRNRKYFREALMFRGSARRNTDNTSKKTGKLRIR